MNGELDSDASVEVDERPFDLYKFSLQMLDAADTLVSQIGNVELDLGPFEDQWQALLNSHLVAKRPLHEFFLIELELENLMHMQENGDRDSLDKTSLVQLWVNFLSSINLPDQYIPLPEDILGDQRESEGLATRTGDPKLGAPLTEEYTPADAVEGPAVNEEDDSIDDGVQASGGEEPIEEEVVELVFNGAVGYSELLTKLAGATTADRADMKLLGIIAGFGYSSKVSLEQIAEQDRRINGNNGQPDLSKLIASRLVVEVSAGVYQINPQRLVTKESGEDDEAEMGTNQEFGFSDDGGSLVGPKGTVVVKDPFIMKRLKEAPDKNGIIEFNIVDLHKQGCSFTNTSQARAELQRILNQAGVVYENNPNGKERGWVSIQITALKNKK